MAKHKPKQLVPAQVQADSVAGLRKALVGQSKAALVNLLLEMAGEDRAVLRQLTARFDVARAPVELVAATRQAIADATDFDERQINYNFDYDYKAYEEVKRNLKSLVDAGQLPLNEAIATGAMLPFINLPGAGEVPAHIPVTVAKVRTDLS